MISLRKSFVFIHIPKTGGNSIQDVLRSYSEDRLVITHGTESAPERFGVASPVAGLLKHSPLSSYANALDDGVFNRLFKFCSVRNPWERMVSLYFSPHRNRTEWKRDLFRQVVKEAKTMLHFVERSHGRRMAFLRRPIHVDVDAVMRFERLQKDFDHVCTTIGIPQTVLPQRNASRHRNYKEYYDRELIDWVAKWHRRDIEYFGYGFDD